MSPEEIDNEPPEGEIDFISVSCASCIGKRATSVVYDLAERHYVYRKPFFVLFLNCPPVPFPVLIIPKKGVPLGEVVLHVFFIPGCIGTR